MHMIAPFRLRRRARLAIARFTRDARATVLIEMAFAIPFLVLVGFGGIEIANLTLTQTRVSQIRLSADDHPSRIARGPNLAPPQVREADIHEVLAGVETPDAHMALTTHGRLTLSRREPHAPRRPNVHMHHPT